MTEIMKKKLIQKAKIAMLEYVEQELKEKEKYGADIIANWSVVQQLREQLQTSRLTGGAK